MKIMHVLGLAPGIENYKRIPEIETIGVNDIFKYTYVDNLVVLDNIETFSRDRLVTILSSRPRRCFSHLDEWNGLWEYRKISLNEKGGDVSTLDDFSQIPRHVDSTFTAVCLAYWLGAKQIEMHYVSFYGHPSLTHYFDKISQCYSDLKEALHVRGVKLVSSTNNSLLNTVLDYLPQ